MAKPRSAAAVTRSTRPAPPLGREGRPTGTCIAARIAARIAAGVLGLVALAALDADLARAANPDALWTIVHEQCAVTVAPCVSLNQAGHYALLKDQRGLAQFLLIPTDRISGIEAPALRDPATPNFMAEAWTERAAVDGRLPRPLNRDEVSLAVNAQTARSQNQLHIHIDCLSREAHDALARLAPAVGDHWAPLPEPVAGHEFLASRVRGDSLGSYNPFLALADSLPDAPTAMAAHNLVVVGANFADGPGFLVLTDVAPVRGLGHAGGEDVQDHGCAIAQ